MARAPGLHVDGVMLERGGRAILRDLSFHVKPGTALMVTGPNGAGKSTLLRALAGLLPLAAGTVRLEDAAAEPGTPVAERAHYLGHHNGQKLPLTPRANLAFAAAWAGHGGATIEEALSAVGLGALADVPLALCSAGQRRRAAIARLLVAARPLWLLDEPATALDASSEATLATLMRAHLARGGLIVAAIHTALDVPARSLRLGPA